MLGTVLLIILILLLIGGWPTWPHMQRHELGYFPSGAFGLVLIVVLILILARMI